jgi:hypothetical protein
VHPYRPRAPALDAGASLRDVQDFAGHRDPRTTRRQSGPGTAWTATPPSPLRPTWPDKCPAQRHCHGQVTAPCANPGRVCRRADASGVLALPGAPAVGAGSRQGAAPGVRSAGRFPDVPSRDGTEREGHQSVRSSRSVWLGATKVSGRRTMPEPLSEGPRIVYPSPSAATRTSATDRAPRSRQTRFLLLDDL